MHHVTTTADLANLVLADDFIALAIITAILLALYGLDRLCKKLFGGCPSEVFANRIMRH